MTDLTKRHRHDTENRYAKYLADNLVSLAAANLSEISMASDQETTYWIKLSCCAC